MKAEGKALFQFMPAGEGKMTRDKVRRALSIVLPLVGMGLMIFYQYCNTACSYVQGTFMGMDLKLVGILFMAALLVVALPPAFRYPAHGNVLRPAMLSAAGGGEVLLFRFQVLHDTYCPFCLAFGVCVLMLFAVNFSRMNRYLALGSFLAGMGAFALFFEGSVLPLYG